MHNYDTTVCLGGILAAVFAESMYQFKKSNESGLGNSKSKYICFGDNYVFIRSQALRIKSYSFVDCSAKRVASASRAHHCGSGKGSGRHVHALFVVGGVRHQIRIRTATLMNHSAAYSSAVASWRAEPPQSRAEPPQSRAEPPQSRAEAGKANEADDESGLLG